MASTFQLDKNTSDLIIINKIIQMIPSEYRKNIDLNNIEKEEPYPGAKQFIIKDNKGENIAFAAISERTKDNIIWSVYREK